MMTRPSRTERGLKPSSVWALRMINPVLGGAGGWLIEGGGIGGDNEFGVEAPVLGHDLYHVEDAHGLWARDVVDAVLFPHDDLDDAIGEVLSEGGAAELVVDDFDLFAFFQCLFCTKDNVAA